MKTQIEYAREGVVTPQMQQVADNEGIQAEQVRNGVANGTIVIPWNHNRKPSRVAGKLFMSDLRGDKI